LRRQKEAKPKLDELLRLPNPHVHGTCFTEDFFRSQWESQRAFHANQNQEELSQQEAQAQFFERGETLKALMYVINLSFLS
jgi:hypothetical protein